MLRDMYITQGSPYGRWTVAESFTGTVRDKVRCLCTCGNGRNVVVASLVSGASSSCGCAKNGGGKDRIGQRFGFWTIVGMTRGGKARCTCDCGTHKDVNVSNLLRGISTSCGCRINRRKE